MKPNALQIEIKIRGKKVIPPHDDAFQATFRDILTFEAEEPKEKAAGRMEALRQSAINQLRSSLEEWDFVKSRWSCIDNGDPYASISLKADPSFTGAKTDFFLLEDKILDFPERERFVLIWVFRRKNSWRLTMQKHLDHLEEKYSDDAETALKQIKDFLDDVTGKWLSKISPDRVPSGPPKSAPEKERIQKRPPPRDIKEAVEMEIEEHKQKHGESWRRYYFNNFLGNLPFGYFRRNMGEEANEDILFGPCNGRGTSEKKRSMTYAQFFTDIDRTIAEINLDMKEVERLQKTCKVEELYNYVFPLYMRLREKGYNHYPDLI